MYLHGYTSSFVLGIHICIYMYMYACFQERVCKAWRRWIATGFIRDGVYDFVASVNKKQILAMSLPALSISFEWSNELASLCEWIMGTELDSLASRDMGNELASLVNINPVKQWASIDMGNELASLVNINPASRYTDSSNELANVIPSQSTWVLVGFV
jgi:hypothetical protein